MKLFAIAAACALAAMVWGSTCAGTMRDGAVIRNTGSTNFSGYTIKVWSDGSAQTVRSSRGDQPTSARVRGTISKAQAQKFFADLKAAKESGRVIGRGCIKSASFGSTTIVQYHGWTSPDLECPGGGFVIALAAQAHQIAADLHVRQTPVRRPLMPNEPRRAPPSPAAQASPTPESSPAAT